MGLFRTINQNYSTNFKSPEKIEVKEYRAPTDDSLRLLEEMREKTLNSICKVFPVINNDITFVIFKSNDPLSLGCWYVKVTINGVDHITQFYDFKDKYDFVDKIITWFTGLFSKDFLEKILYEEMK